jgi:predicted acylesterase/phospholipase RssA
MGVVRAMREHGIPIDLVAGTSAGALIGYLAAAGVSHEAMGHAATRFHLARPFKGYTLPLFSLLSGDRLSRALEAQCGDTRLEDLWLPLVVVSSNLTRRSVELHTRGPAWEALRASSSLPVLVEPHLRDGQILVDGGLTDNLPVGVARERLAGRVIAVDVTTDLDLTTTARTYPSPWLEAAARLLGRRGRARATPPGMFEVMMHSLLLASLAHTRRMRLEADLCLRPDLADFGLLALERHREIIDAGYQYAREHLSAFAATQ